MTDLLLAAESYWWVFYIGTIVVFLATVEVGFLLGRSRRGKTDPEAKSQAGTALAAILALLGFLLAVSFSIAEDRFMTRKQLVLEEANAIGTTFLRTDFLMEPQRTRARRLLAEYVNVRLEATKQPGTLQEGLKRSVEIQNALWRIADKVAAQRPRSEPVGLFIDALNETIDLHEERVTVSLRNRVPPSLLWTLYLVAFLSMGILGFHFGLGGTRNILAASALVFAFSAVMLLIVDLDQPRQRLFTVNQAALEDTHRSISKALESPPAKRGGSPDGKRRPP
ncbi:bestrophin-like domain [Thiohalorhabdus denitrificans]|uniref:DUF4239 domain-containing protein n=1 Tax=Thiohalorhabdus denitrificans TaxID=381306 RepID=A0A1G5HQL2_9GAMM|nr:hypothetical protein [Thiohalorhabdus denitrificans]SCY66172.1 hypothetical protein SAMN05661077_0062 [Thiohalorhabdus denitrificans]